MTDTIVPISLERLQATLNGLHAIAKNHKTGGAGWSGLVEAMRMVEIEARMQHDATLADPWEQTEEQR